MDVMGMLAVLSAALSLSALPPLPDQGLALETRAGVQLQTLTGRPLAAIAGLDLAVDRKIGRYLVMRDRRGRLYTLWCTCGRPQAARNRALGLGRAPPDG